MVDNLIIFGAGASFGAGSAFFGWHYSPIAKVPPLGNNLFLDLCLFAPTTWGIIPSNFADIFKSDFETGMATIAQSSFSITDLQRALALYFFNFHIGTENLYSKLAALIKNSAWSGALATLNYETLLLQAINSNGLQPISGTNATNHHQIEVCFPHGCCHIFCDSIQARGVDFKIGLSTSGVISVQGDPKTYLNKLNSSSIPPVMSYYEPNKRTLAGINFIEQQRARLMQLIANAQHIAIIGVRFNEYDHHIWKPLADTNAQLIYCSGKGEENIKLFEKWNRDSRSNKSTIILRDFFREAFNAITKFVKLT